ncbi:MAG: hypothetical protein P4L84_36780 [Isosphaeraceae bacterium]|nr:hypothetical protein [Isosphaeraceae bacterium]
MTGRSYLVSRDDPHALRLAADALHEWEPCWDLDVPDRFARLYEADGTLYGFCVGDAMTVSHNHREQRLATADLIVVPRELALDIEPEVELIALRHSGAPPDHFRERFIQVWGFEQIAAGAGEELGRAGCVAVIPAEDVRYPLTYSLTNDWPLRGSTRMNSVLVIAYGGGPCHVTAGAARARHTLAAGDALLMGPGIEFAVEGDGRSGVVTLFHELGQQGRRLDAARAGRPAGPEFDPASRRPR